MLCSKIYREILSLRYQSYLCSISAETMLSIDLDMSLPVAKAELLLLLRYSDCTAEVSTDVGLHCIHVANFPRKHGTLLYQLHAGRIPEEVAIS